MRSGSSPTARLLAALLCMLAAACATPAHTPRAFSFAVMGDTPYTAGEEAQFEHMLASLDREPLAFIVHVGDIKGGAPCTDELFLKRRAQFDRSAHPFFYTPGDNEWTDCRGMPGGPRDPIERLQRLRHVFFEGEGSLGRTSMAAESQRECAAPASSECGCMAYPENRAWSVPPVRFVTLNVAGSDNNDGYDAANDREAHCRNAANRAWLERWIDASTAPEVRALVVMVQANPWFIIRTAGVFDGFLAQLREAAARLHKPVLLVHGDTHVYRADRPFVDAFGEPLPWLSRLETYGSPFVGWVRVTADPETPELFTFEPNLFAVVPRRVP
jgi:hypothetical protein